MQKCQIQAVSWDETKVFHPDQYSDTLYEFSPPRVYRIWYPQNIEVHLSTVLLVSWDGQQATCLRIVSKKEEEAGYEFKRHHIKIRVGSEGQPMKRASRQTPRSPEPSKEPEHADDIVLYLRPGQVISSDCWIDLAHPWNITWRNNQQKDPYKLCQVGMLHDQSQMTVKRKHLKVYSELLGISLSVITNLNMLFISYSSFVDRDLASRKVILPTRSTTIPASKSSRKATQGPPQLV